jgi:hypothetical protein
MGCFHLRLVLLLGLLFSFSYTQAQKPHQFNQLAGTYESPDYSFFEKVYYTFLNPTFIFAGTTLELEDDSSFHKTTCGIITTGDWSIEADTLLLHIKTNRWRNDSLHQHGFNGEWPKLPSHPEKYIIDGKMLRQRHTIKHEGREKRAIFDLERVPPNEK